MFNYLYNFFNNKNAENQQKGINKFKVSNIVFYDGRNHVRFGAFDPFMCTMMSLEHTHDDGGEFCTKEELLQKLRSLTYSGMFEKVNLLYRVKPDKTLAVVVHYYEYTWPLPRDFRCINMRVMPRMKPNNKTDFYEAYDEDRPCLLPPSVHHELVEMIVGEAEELSGRLMYKIKEGIDNWYYDEGYICAQVVNFSGMDTEEFVCEVFEGEITKLVLVTEDENNVITKLPLENKWKEWYKALEVGEIYNKKAGNQVIRNLMSLGLFSSIEVHPIFDEIYEGGVIVEIKLRFKKQ